MYDILTTVKCSQSLKITTSNHALLILTLVRDADTFDGAVFISITKSLYLWNALVCKSTEHEARFHSSRSDVLTGILSSKQYGTMVLLPKSTTTFPLHVTASNTVWSDSYVKSVLPQAVGQLLMSNSC